jgi:predicted dehydrogenase
MSDGDVMTSHNKRNLAVIGVGVMGTSHVKDIAGLEQARLAAVCDIDKQKADSMAALYQVPAVYDYRKLLEMEALDGVVIATPHYAHTPISIAFLERGVHVLTEKPVAVHVNDAQKMIDAYENARKMHPNLVFAIMFQQRTYGFWRKIKAMIDGGELGKLVRTSWIITDWFRTQTYYDNGGWRATWSGEGGGVLLNQCPHNLDLYQWFVGMPKRVSGFASIGKYHNIEVEDAVTGYFEDENGMVGHFLTTTAESPGSNRLEIVGELGKLVFEAGKLTFDRNRESMFEFIKTCPRMWDKVDSQVEEIPFEHHGESGHRLVIENFVNAILQGEALIAPAVEGIRSLTLGNAIMQSSFLGRPVDLPIDADAYEAALQERIRSSRFQKNVHELPVESEIGKSFGYH